MSEYAAGACNIGPAEIAQRQRSGWVGLVATVALAAVLWALAVDPWYRLILVAPPTSAAPWRSAEAAPRSGSSSP